METPSKRPDNPILLLCGTIFCFFIAFKCCNFLTDSSSTEKQVQLVSKHSYSNASTDQDHLLDYTAYDLLSTYLTNKSQGEEIFKGREIKITGIFHASKSSGNGPYIILADEENEYPNKFIECYLSERDYSKIYLTKGQKISLKGTVGTLHDNLITMYECELR